MTARDLALWDISLIERKLLSPPSLDAMITPARLKNGAPLPYALGVNVFSESGHPRMEHGGAISGFVSSNTVWPDQGAAVVVLCNKGNSGAPAMLSSQIGRLLLKEQLDPQARSALDQAKSILSSLQQGTIDTSQLTDDAIAYFRPDVIADYAASLKLLGTPRSVEQVSTGLRGGFRYRSFRLDFPSKTLRLTTFADSGGKLAQFLISE